MLTQRAADQAELQEMSDRLYRRDTANIQQLKVAPPSPDFCCILHYSIDSFQMHAPTTYLKQYQARLSPQYAGLTANKALHMSSLTLFSTTMAKPQILLEVSHPPSDVPQDNQSDRATLPDTLSAWIHIA